MKKYMCLFLTVGLLLTGMLLVGCEDQKGDEGEETTAGETEAMTFPFFGKDPIVLPEDEF